MGFVAVRKQGALFPGPKRSVTAATDYRGHRHRLAIQQVLTGGDRVLMVDDWAERGAQALAVRELVEACGATFVGVSLIVDQLDDELRARLVRVASIVRATDLGPSG